MPLSGRKVKSPEKRGGERNNTINNGHLRLPRSPDCTRTPLDQFWKVTCGCSGLFRAGASNKYSDALSFRVQIRIALFNASLYVFGLVGWRNIKQMYFGLVFDFGSLNMYKSTLCLGVDTVPSSLYKLILEFMILI
jgi:hypothetical protein